MRRRGTKGKWRRVGGTIGWGFQVMLIPLIYLISGWRWALFTSDVPLLGKTEERGGETEGENGEDERMNEYQKTERGRQRRRLADWFPGAGWWDGWSEV